MKKTKTITFHASYNYGAVLQAYSLQQYLLVNEIENEIIDYRGENYKTPKILSGDFSLRSLFFNFQKMKHVFKIKTYRKKIDDFVQSNLLLTKFYKNHSEIEKNIPNADCFICGSDQIWNISVKITPAYFLDFIKNQKKISYATSFGVTCFDDFQENFIKKELSTFNHLSVREKQGLDILKTMGVNDAQVCLDPVFLNSKEFWIEKCKDYNQLTPKHKYVICYELSFNNNMQRCVDDLKRKTGLPVYVVCPGAFTRLKGVKKIINAGALEFLNLILNAEYAILSSFHGLAFSILFEKKFLAYANSTNGSRLLNLLKILDLEKNLIESSTNISVLEKINYTSVNDKLKFEVEKSKKFLLGAINE